MKRNLIKSLGLACALGCGMTQASATLFSSSSAVGIPDGNAVGVSSAINVGGLGNILSSGDNVSVTLNLSGGNIGDLYAYLQFNNTKVVLMNQPGGGTYLGGGFSSVTLSDNNSVNVDSYGGGSVNNVSFNPSAGGTAFQAFNGMSANGTWTLFFADLSGNDGANVTTLNSWSLDVTPVPEPVNVALIAFAAIFGGFAIARGVRRARL
jgi:subtilisin-like proprotein convertase family protein